MPQVYVNRGFAYWLHPNLGVEWSAAGPSGSGWSEHIFGLE